MQKISRYDRLEPMFLGKLTNLFWALCAFLILALLAWFFIFKSNNGFVIKSNSAAVVKEMRSLERLETASFTIEKVIDAGTPENNVFQQFLFGNRILLIAHGQVIAGFDLSRFSDKDLDIKGKNLTVNLPPPQILVTALDNSQTRVYDRQQGLLNTNGNNLESQARTAAETAIRDAACKSGILQQAADNARKQLTALFYGLGFTTVTLNIPTGTC